MSYKSDLFCKCLKFREYFTWFPNTVLVDSGVLLFSLSCVVFFCKIFYIQF